MDHNHHKNNSTEKKHESHSEKNGQSHDHDHHHEHMADDFRKRFWISLALTIPVLLFSSTIQGWFNYSLVFTGRDYLIFGLASLLFFYGGWPFLKGMVSEMKKKQPGMMTLIALAIIVAYCYSSAIVFGLQGRPFFWELSTLIVVMLAGHWVEMRSQMKASGALDELMKLMPDTAHRITDEGTEEVKVSSLGSGDKVLVKPGEKIPADAIIVEGKSYIDESVISGESKPVQRKKDDKVVAGSVNGKSTLTIEVKDTGEDTYLSKVVGMVSDARAEKSRMQNLANRAAFWLTIIAIASGSITLAAWLAAGRDFNFALSRMVTVMVIACPHALGLAIPLVAAISTSVSARNGLLVRNRTSFENAGKTSVVVFDKTGTLTEGKYGVSNYESLADDVKNNELLRMAAAVESGSEHPIASGILNKAEEEEIEVPEASDVESMTGEGVKGKVEGKEVKIVSPSYLEKHDIEFDTGLLKETGSTVVFILVEDTLTGYITLSDQLRKNAGEAIAKLRSMGIDSWLMSGDNEQVTRSISEKLEMKGYFADVMPDEKEKKIQDIRDKGNFIAMTGDGVNDAPALARADLGIAIGSGTDVAAETADVILVNSNPMDVARLINFGKATHKKMIQNLIYATAYNVVALPLGAGALAWAGIMISPAAGAMLMSLSTVVVAINAQLLRKQLK